MSEPTDRHIHVHAHAYTQRQKETHPHSAPHKQSQTVTPANALILCSALGQQYQVVSVFLHYWDVIIAQKEQKQVHAQNLSSLERFNLGYG